jgi:hypothetical protein
MTYEELEQDVLAYIDNCSAASLVDLFNYIHDCKAEVEWDGEDNPKVNLEPAHFDCCNAPKDLGHMYGCPNSPENE